MCGLVISYLDYANGNLFGISEQLLDHMQRVQNLAARLVLRENKNFSSGKLCMNCIGFQFVHILSTKFDQLHSNV